MTDWCLRGRFLGGRVHGYPFCGTRRGRARRSQAALKADAGLRWQVRRMKTRALVAPGLAGSLGRPRLEGSLNCERYILSLPTRNARNESGRLFDRMSGVN